MSEERSPAMAEQYWYNTETHEVEVGRMSSWSHLMGPYKTRDEALQALEHARQRSDAWDKEDENWKTGGPKS